MALTEKLTAIADAIREKTNTTEKITLAKMPEMISAITGGGGAATEYVNFYDYDGSLLHQYPLPIFEKMAALPMPPNSRTDCECVGWNYDLETIKAMKSHVNVAAIYNQKDEEVETHTPGEPVYVDGTKLYIHFDYELKITLYFRQTVAQGVTVHWGDGESSVSSTSYGSSNLSLSHTFQAGDYVIRFEVAEGCILSLGYSSTSYCLLGYVGSISSSYVPVWNTLRKAEIDLRNTTLLTAAFRYCIGLKEVVFGSGRSITIPSYCFDACYSLETVQLRDNISAIYEQAFRYCYRLRNITIPTSVTSIGSYAFSDCRRLHDISIPGTVTTISSYAFQYCTALKSVHLGSGVKTLGSYLFAYCSHLQEVNLPNTIKTLNSNIFLQCYALKEIVVPKGITSIPAYFCQNCTSLKTVLLPDGLTQISGNAFSGCQSLGFVAIPKSVTIIYDSAFTNCYALRNAVIGMGVKDIRAYAFQNAYGLEYIVVPPSVTKLGVRAFGYSRCLKNMVLPQTLVTEPGCIVTCEIPSAQTTEYYNGILEKAAAIQEYAFDSNRCIENAEIPENITMIGTYAFQNNYALKKVSLPYGLLTVDSYAFRYDYQLQTVPFPVSLTTIGQNAFEQNISIEEVVLPGSVRTVSGYAFQNCYGLHRLDIRGNNMVLNTSAFSGCYGLRELWFSPGVTNVTLAGNVFYSAAFERLVSFPQKTHINSSGIFQQCHCLEKIDLTNAVFDNSSASNSMFISCYALDEIALPDQFSVVGSYMFQNCYSLKRIALSKAMMTICSYAFNECRNLEAIEFRGTQLTNIQGSAFYNCWQLREIHIPYSVTSMSQCFSYCYALHDIYMYPLTAPTGTTSIGSFPTGYLIHVPKGSLASYEKQWTGHKGHFVEFEYFKLASSQSKKTLLLSENEIVLTRAFSFSELSEGNTPQISVLYNGTNLTADFDAEIDLENHKIRVGFQRNEKFSYDISECLTVVIDFMGEQQFCDITLEYKDSDIPDYEYGFESLGTIQTYTNTWEIGWQFTANVDMEICGLRFLMPNAGAYHGKLWSSNGTKLASVYVDAVSQQWTDGFFEEPVAISAGASCIISCYTTGWNRATGAFSFNDKIKFTTSRHGSAKDSFPANSEGGWVNNPMDIIFRPL